MKIKFIGAAREVTGSKHLITLDNGKKILLDCGMFQGKGMETDSSNRNLGFDPREIDHIILTHAHIDHSGLIPYVYKLGFRGSVICTNATRDLCAIMLADSGHIQELDVKWYNKKLIKRGMEPIEPIYTTEHAKMCMELFIGVAYNRKFYIDENIKVRFTNNGHLLGAGTVSLEITENDKTVRLAYTGDIGRPVSRILKAPEAFRQCDYLITESTYGNRLHEQFAQAEEELLKVVMDTCVRKQGKLIIPSFAIGRTQDIVFTLNNFFNAGRLPKIQIYVDSPLAVNATTIFRVHQECFNDEVMKVLETDDDPFGFNSLHYITSTEDSKKLNFFKNPCIIISASGMMEAGRIKHHLANNISSPNNTILVVGYCAPRTLGARLVNGEKTISIFGNKYQVNAEIARIEAFSGHGDYSEMLSFLNCQDKSAVRKVFLVHGDYETQRFYKEQMESSGFSNIEIPEPMSEFTL
ncbi:MAG TPA: MBL fold metallo-hydrolase [Prolixibacteraceae bacterium]|nr:MBL fold metallo-hydrolase [Prolixibacteraceae bacterium]